MIIDQIDSSVMFDVLSRMRLVNSKQCCYDEIRDGHSRFAIFGASLLKRPHSVLRSSFGTVSNKK